MKQETTTKERRTEAMQKKLLAAIDYIEKHQNDADPINDAANITATSYEEYLMISAELERIFPDRITETV